jgi:hypothetical protein
MGASYRILPRELLPTLQPEGNGVGECKMGSDAYVLLSGGGVGGIRRGGGGRGRSDNGLEGSDGTAAADQSIVEVLGRLAGLKSLNLSCGPQPAHRDNFRADATWALNPSTPTPSSLLRSYRSTESVPTESVPTTPLLAFTESFPGSLLHLSGRASQRRLLP